MFLYLKIFFIKYKYNSNVICMFLISSLGKYSLRRWLSQKSFTFRKILIYIIWGNLLKIMIFFMGIAQLQVILYENIYFLH